MDKLKLENFDWGWMDSDNVEINIRGEITTLGKYHKKHIMSEIFILGLYEKFFEVAENDIVVDIGASNGPFTYSILHKKPKHVYCLEPSYVEFPILVKNTCGYPVTPINKGISDSDALEINNQVFGGDNRMEGITFNRFCQLYNIEKIDFLKTDCEGGEYHIFTQENLPFIKENVGHIVGELHLSSVELKNQFMNFRDNFLVNFERVNVFSVNGVDITRDLFKEHFIEYYTEVIIYIDNSYQKNIIHDTLVR
jgi:FkbM family methyltransferase